MRLNKAIASSGLCSRRAADELIADGKVRVNGRIVSDFNALVDFHKDNLVVDGKRLFAREHEYVILHKPKGVVSTCQDEYSRSNIMDLLPKKLHHLKPAGRLDYDSSGLILLTNDGPLINVLTHPTKEIEKTYQIIVSGKVTPQALTELSAGVLLREAKTKKAKVRLIASKDSFSTVQIIIAEGKNRQIRRMCAQLGLPVLELVRTGVSKLQLGSLAVGKWRYLNRSEISDLRRDLGIQYSAAKNELGSNRPKTKISQRR